jgi:hypothetical protein
MEQMDDDEKEGKNAQERLKGKVVPVLNYEGESVNMSQMEVKQL